MKIQLYVKNIWVIALFATILLGSEALFAGGPEVFSTKKDKKSCSLCTLKPEIGISTGTLSFLGDVGYFKLQDPFLYKYAYALDVEFLYKYNLVFAGNLMMGNLFGNQKTLLQNVNFQSSVFIPSAQVRYYLLKSDRSKRTLTPFVSVGVEGIIFNTSSDLTDKDGRTYFYWNDGTIKDKSETDKDKAKAVLLHRDYKYETKAKSGFTMGFPIGLGVKLKLTEHLNASLSASYHFSISDEIDNVSKSPAGVTGNAGPDKFLYPSFSIHYDMGGQASEKKSTAASYKDVDFLAIEYVDGDGDGVTDFKDRCPNTPREVKVNEAGCPLDDDNDGVPNYRDKEKATRAGDMVDEYGVEINDNYLLRKAQEDSIKFRGDTVYLKVTNTGYAQPKKVEAEVAPVVVAEVAKAETPVAETKPTEETTKAEETPTEIKATPSETPNTNSVETPPAAPPVVAVESTPQPEKAAAAEKNKAEKAEKKSKDEVGINISNKKPFILKGLNFKSQSFELSKESKSYLNQIAVYVKENPSTKFEIGGHTDDTGGKGLNQRLSYDRAKAVYFYLLSKGVNKTRLSYEGYGSTFPIAPNTTEEGKAKNRRIELKIVK